MPTNSTSLQLPKRGYLTFGIALAYIGFINYYLLCLLLWGKLVLRFKFRDIRYPPFVIALLCLHI